VRPLVVFRILLQEPLLPFLCGASSAAVFRPPSVTDEKLAAARATSEWRASFEILQEHFGGGTQQGRKGDVATHPTVRIPPYASGSARQQIEFLPILSRDSVGQAVHRRNPFAKGFTV
jgi:hypothetical protein